MFDVSLPTLMATSRVGDSQQAGRRARRWCDLSLASCSHNSRAAERGATADVTATNQYREDSGLSALARGAA